MKKLPLGIQTFEKIREDNYLYVDKTAIAEHLINTYDIVFLSRPRRFVVVKLFAIFLWF